MIRLRNITLRRGPVALLADASATLSHGERVALVGPNGSGKSSLLAVLADELVLDGGDIDRPPMRVMKLEQSTPGGDRPAWRQVLMADATLMAAEAALTTAEAALVAAEAAPQTGEPAPQTAEPAGGLALAEAHDRWDEAGGHSARARVGELLAGLGFSAEQVEQPVDRLSGGWRMRLNLARALFVPSDLLLLDEPTNHLDLDAIVWLERWLRRYEGTALVVSHDRDFLDRVADATLSIEDDKLVRYSGGYSAFESQRAQRQEHLAKAAASQAQRIAHLTSFIERFRAKATKARQAQSRMKALEKLVAIAPAREQRGVDFSLPEVDDAPDPLILVSGLACGYPSGEALPDDAAAPGAGATGPRVILSGVSLTVGRSARIGLLGRNGAGKSTLIRTLVGDLPALAGEVRRARSLRIGYFAQHAVEALRADESPLAMLRRLRPDDTEALLRSELGRFGFSGDDATRPIGPMSGGEKSRLVLSTIVHARPHVLILDEPTNHLDAATRDTLTDALADFEGALLLVSHDRYLMRATVDTLMLVHDGRLDEFDGDLDDYLQFLQRQPAGQTGSHAARGTSGTAADAAAMTSAGRTAAAAATEAGGAGAATAELRGASIDPQANDRRQARRDNAARRQRIAERLKPIDAEIRRIEAELAEVEQELTRVSAELADPAIYRDNRRASETGRLRAELQRRKDDAESRWLEASERREQVERED